MKESGATEMDVYTDTSRGSRWRVYGENEREREWDLGEKEAEKGPGSGRGAQSIKCPAETFSALYEISAFFLSPSLLPLFWSTP